MNSVLNLVLVVCKSVFNSPCMDRSFSKNLPGFKPILMYSQSDIHFFSSSNFNNSFVNVSRTQPAVSKKLKHKKFFSIFHQMFNTTFASKIVFDQIKYYIIIVILNNSTVTR